MRITELVGTPKCIGIFASLRRDKGGCVLSEQQGIGVRPLVIHSYSAFVILRNPTIYIVCGNQQESPYVT